MNTLVCAVSMWPPTKQHPSCSNGIGESIEMRLSKGGLLFFLCQHKKKIDHITHLFISEKSIPRQNCALGFAHQFHDGCVALHVPLLPHFQLKICTNMQKQKLLFSKLTLTTKKYIVCDYYCVDSHFDVRLSNLMRQ